MAVITISREAGSGGDEIARLVSKILGYQYFDKTLMADVAHEQGISEAEVVDFSEDSYHLRSFIDALLHRSAAVSTTTAWTTTTRGEETRVSTALDEETAAKLVASTIRALGERGRVVVVGRGGQAILRGVAGVLHVRIVAGREDRIPRLMETEHLARHAANDMMEARDRTTAEYLKRFYNVDPADPLLYHLVVNTSAVSVEDAAQLIVAAVRRMEGEPAPEPSAALAR